MGDVTHGEGEAAAVVDGVEADLDDLADFEGVFDSVETFVADLGDVEHAVDAGHDVDEGAEIFDGDYCAGVDFADFGFFY